MKKAILIGIPFLVLLALVGWRYTQKTETVKQLQSRSAGLKNGPANVVLGVAAEKAVDKTFEAVGTVQSPYNVELSPKLTGKIVFLPDYIRQGYPVKAGQLICQIDPTETMGQVLQARAQLAQAQSTLISAKYIEHPTNVNVESQIDQSVATVRSNKADYDQVNENYEVQVHQAHALVIDSQAKLAAAKSAVYSADATLGSANANLVDAKAKLNRENTLYKQGYVAAQDVDDAIAAEKVAEANVGVANGGLRSAKSAQDSAEAQLRSAEDNEAIVKKTGTTNIRAALEKVKLAQAALKYSQSNVSQKPAYLAQLAADQAAVDAAAGSLKQAEARLADCDLKATIDGTVSARNADIGTVVNAGSSIVEIQYSKWLYVSTAVPVEYTGMIVKGTPVTMTFDAVAGFKLEGTVTELSNVADPQSRQFTAMVKIDNSAGKFRAGMYAAVRFFVSTKTYPVVVPREAVKIANDNSATVTQVDADNVAHVTPVTVGPQDTNNIVVTSGLSVGDHVVVLSYTTVRDKQKVTEGRKPKAGQGKGKSIDSAGVSAPPSQSADGEVQPGTKARKKHRGSDAAGTSAPATGTNN